MGRKSTLRKWIARASLAVFCVLFLGLSYLTAKEGVSEYARLARLELDGVAVTGTISHVEIEKRRPVIASTGKEDRTRWEYLRMATIRYGYEDRVFESDVRYWLTDSFENAQVGDPYPLLILPDDPERTWAPHLVAGASFAVFATPALLLLAAALCGFGAAYRPLWAR
ncbi:MAG: hypothetical protein KDG50_00570 [Chromatiales bacterium]|nr:hypothetical protein [Chromatiales bacterium]